MTEFTAVGAGLAGLVAAIQVAESVGERSYGAGVRVTLHEAAGEVGGRARTDRGDRRVNLGPHALYRHGAFETWLLARGLTPPVTWPRARSALYDVAFTPRRGDATAVLDLDQRVFASRDSRRDLSLVASDESLAQACTGVREGERTARAHARIEEVLDAGFPGWRERTRWRRRGVSEGASPADPPGASWRNRPAVDRGDDRWLAGNYFAAPGVLSEVSFESARQAATRAVEKCLGAPTRPQESS